MARTGPDLRLGLGDSSEFPTRMTSAQVFQRHHLLAPRVHVSKKLESDLEADPHGGHHTLCIFGEVSLLALSSIVHSWLHRSHPHETD